MELDQRRSLYVAKLKALARSEFGLVGEPTSLPFGAFLSGVDPTPSSDDAQMAVVYLADDPTDHFGAALASAHRKTATRVVVLLDDADAASILARRAKRLRITVEVLHIIDRDLHAAAPAPQPQPSESPTGVDDLVSVIKEAGLDVTIEHGAITGELLGLELARIVELDGQQILDVGVGKFDQEAGAMLRGATPAAQSLHEAAIQIGEIRSSTGPAAHGLNRVARERWMRAAVLADPSTIDVAALVAVEPLVPRVGVLSSIPAAALATDGTLVVCSLGTDLEVVSHSADLVARHDATSLVHVVPEGKALPIVGELMDLLDVPVRTRPITPPWPS